MRLFSCDSCGQLLFFENVSCTGCGATLGFAPDTLRMLALQSAGDNQWRRAGTSKQSPVYRHCNNRLQHAVCNWLIAAGDSEDFCIACRLNQTIPDLAVAGNIDLWRKLEIDKRRLVYSLIRFDLPLTPKSRDREGLAFNFLGDKAPSFNESGRVMTGHAAGLITINIAEADAAARERMRSQMAEPYRTILGHFRHESGHYYWDRLVRQSDWLEPFRTLFGDETADYQMALQAHYDKGPPGDWEQRFISAYASMHPWEDWAEHWAHYLHIVDTLETAYQYGLSVRPKTQNGNTLEVDADFNPYRQDNLSTIVEHWLPLTYALNSLNRSMGHDHLYPFVLAEPVIEKLDFIHRVVRHSAGA